MTHSALEALAALELDLRHRDKRDRLRDRRGLLEPDADGHALGYRIPSPFRLASVYVGPLLREVYDLRRRGSDVVARRLDAPEDHFQPIKPEVLADVLLGRLRDLPERHDARDYYRDLRAFASLGAPHRVSRYLADTVAALPRTGLPTYRERAIRPPAATPAERLAKHRQKLADRERLSSAWWLEDFLEPEDETDRPKPGARFHARQLLEDARHILADLETDEEPIDDDDENPLRFKSPRGPIFYAEADRLIAPRRRSASGYYYEIPAQPKENVLPTATADLGAVVLDRALDRGRRLNRP
ncbi:hypothetical protein [Naasia sp. SYSU D00057]|uniref:hypothetical protein n=1 Tax=Naasia sp. SYSU D00057 TaxID=2817380 RepID=UPI001B302166|nr:hypothetical protein [Naasia sp. SYSU D00057]